jgi:hypothetical protein
LLETANCNWDTADKKEKQIGESIKLVFFILCYQSIKQNKINEIKLKKNMG